MLERGKSVRLVEKTDPETLVLSQVGMDGNNGGWAYLYGASPLAATNVQLAIDEDFFHESITGTIFRGRLIEQTQIGSYQAVVPTIAGQAWIYGLTNYVLDPTDPFPRGYKVGDIW